MDRILRATAGDGFIKMSAVSAKDTVQRAKDIHGCTPTTAAALGRTLCAASMLGNMMKEDDGSLTIRINGGGPIGSVIAVSDSAGFVRGYVTNPSVELPLREDGKLIAEDLTAYMLESEQIPAACGLGVLVDTDLSIKSAGGFIVQLMPGAPDELIDKLEENITMMDALTTILAEDGLEAVFEQVLKGLEHHIVGEDEIGYRCKCSRERVASAILGIGKDELESMVSEGKDVDVSCQFCDTVYTFTPDDISALLKQSKND